MGGLSSTRPQIFIRPELTFRAESAIIVARRKPRNDTPTHLLKGGCPSDCASTSYGGEYFFPRWVSKGGECMELFSAIISTATLIVNILMLIIMIQAQHTKK